MVILISINYTKTFNRKYISFRIKSHLHFEIWVERFLCLLDRLRLKNCLLIIDALLKDPFCPYIGTCYHLNYGNMLSIHNSYCTEIEKMQLKSSPTEPKGSRLESRKSCIFDRFKIWNPGQKFILFRKWIPRSGHCTTS